MTTFNSKAEVQVVTVIQENQVPGYREPHGLGVGASDTSEEGSPNSPALGPDLLQSP